MKKIVILIVAVIIVLAGCEKDWGYKHVFKVTYRLNKMDSTYYPDYPIENFSFFNKDLIPEKDLYDFLITQNKGKELGLDLYECAFVLDTTEVIISNDWCSKCQHDTLGYNHYVRGYQKYTPTNFWTYEPDEVPDIEAKKEEIKEKMKKILLEEEGKEMGRDIDTLYVEYYGFLQGWA